MFQTTNQHLLGMNKNDWTSCSPTPPAPCERRQIHHEDHLSVTCLGSCYAKGTHSIRSSKYVEVRRFLLVLNVGNEGMIHNTIDNPSNPHSHPFPAFSTSNCLNQKPLGRSLAHGSRFLYRCLVPYEDQSILPLFVIEPVGKGSVWETSQAC